MPKIEEFRLRDLSVKGEGNLHIIVRNERTSNVFRFCKETRRLITDEKINVSDIDLERIYKLNVSHKVYNIFCKFWGKYFIPKTRVSTISGRLLEQICEYLESQRLENRKHKMMVIETCNVEIQPDLTKLRDEFSHVIMGNTYCIELKLKYGILLPKPHSTFHNFSSNGDNLIPGVSGSRFCMYQNKKNRKDRSEYCPCDMYSGDINRMKRSIKALIVNNQEKLRIFQNSKRVMEINKDVICGIMQSLSNDKSKSMESYIDAFCELIVYVLKMDPTNKHMKVKLPFPTSTNCVLHANKTFKLKTKCIPDLNGNVCRRSGDIECSNSNNSANLANGNDNNYLNGEAKTSSYEVFEGSVLGHLITKCCLSNYLIDEIKDKYDILLQYLEENNIEKRDCIFQLWNECLLPLNLPSHIIEIVKIIKKFMISLTARDCSIMICISKLGQGSIIKNLKPSLESNTFKLYKMNDDLELLTAINVIDISMKPLSKIYTNYKAELELITK